MSKDDRAPVNSAGKSRASPTASLNQSTSREVVTLRRESKVQEKVNSNRQSISKGGRGEGGTRRGRLTSVGLQGSHVPVATARTESPETEGNLSKLRGVRESGSPNKTVTPALENGSVSPSKADATSAPHRQPSSPGVRTDPRTSQPNHLPRSSTNQDRAERSVHRRDGRRTSNMRPSTAQRRKDTPDAERTVPSRRRSRSALKSDSDSDLKDQDEKKYDHERESNQRQTRLGKNEEDGGGDEEEGYYNGDEHLGVGKQEEAKAVAARCIEGNGGNLLSPLSLQVTKRGNIETEMGLEENKLGVFPGLFAGSVPQHSVPNTEASSMPSLPMETFGVSKEASHERQTNIELVKQSEESGGLGEAKHGDSLDLRENNSSNFISLRCSHASRESLELFEKGKSDYSSDGSDEYEPRKQGESKIAKQPIKATPKNILELNLGQDSLSGIAAAAKATVRRNITTSKYLKLLSPSISAHQSHGVLATIHRQMNGRGWPRRGGWDSYLVRNSRAELDDGRVYGVKSKEGCVQLLVLASNNVCGRLPVDIARLSSLKCLDLSNNHISGSIPAELGLLLQLQTLQLQGNNLRDEISPLLGCIINLVRLSLGNNKLSGQIPDSMGNLVHLKFLSLEHNRLTGQIPSFLCRLPVLENFNASSNQLGGVIPEGIGSLRKLKKLDLSDNLLEGTMPDSLCTLRLLSWLRLDSNQLEGEVPAQFSSLNNLLVLNLNSNGFSGPIPAALGRCTDIMTAYLRGNSFHGPCLLTVAQASSKGSGIRKLDLGCNDLEEPLPNLTGLRDLQMLLMDNNRLYGGLSEDLTSACPSLSKLYLQSNRLTGEIPESLSTLTKLEDLDLSDNCFKGYLPSGLQSLQLLRAFSASNNELSGELPPFLGSLTELTRLALDGNNFEGTIPRELGNLTSLEGLYLERNELVGSIPGDLSKCVSLRELYLHENKMRGTIPDSLRSLVELRYLYLHKNRLTGTVPEWLAELQHLQGLILGENRLRGTIPWQLGHLHKLEDLYLNDNNLEGGIPERLVVNCERLQRLVVAGNHLTGRVPRSLTGAQDLRELNIEMNNMHGELPIPLFLKTSLGPHACGLKFGGNPRIIDSREHFASTVAGIRRAGARSALSASTSSQKKRLRQRKALMFALRSVMRAKPRDKPLSSSPSRRLSVSSMKTVGEAAGLSSDFFSEKDVEKGTEDNGRLTVQGADRNGLARPWVGSEDVSYFLVKVVLGNALVLLDFIVAVRLYEVGCIWGTAFIVIWKAMAALEGVAATRRLGYGKRWQSLAAVGLALPLESRRCFYHSCESDLFQALQEVEWCWHVMVQLVTQLAAALACWGYSYSSPALICFGVSMATKGLVVGVVSMQRLDNQRLLRAWGNEAAQQPVSLVKTTWLSALKANVGTWVRGSALPRLLLVAFHMAELSERTIPLSVLTASLGYWTFFAPFVMVPGMIVRYITRRGRASGTGGILFAVKKALAISLALDSAFGAGTPAHLVALIATTVETVTFKSFAVGNLRDYPPSLGDAMLSWCSAMLIYTWLVFLLERFVPLELELPSLLSPPLLTPLSKPCVPSMLSQAKSSVRIVESGKGGVTGVQGGQSKLVVPTEGSGGDFTNP